jgi:hypothetical protein
MLTRVAFIFATWNSNFLNRDLFYLSICFQKINTFKIFKLKLLLYMHSDSVIFGSLS